jgi:hypothetical protein
MGRLINGLIGAGATDEQRGGENGNHARQSAWLKPAARMAFEIGYFRAGDESHVVILSQQNPATPHIESMSRAT